MDNDVEVSESNVKGCSQLLECMKLTPDFVIEPLEFEVGILKESQQNSQTLFGSNGSTQSPPVDSDSLLFNWPRRKAKGSGSSSQSTPKEEMDSLKHKFKENISNSCTTSPWKKSPDYPKPKRRRIFHPVIEENDGTKTDYADLYVTLSQLDWALQQLKYNPVETDSDLMEMVNTLCDGVGNIVVALTNMPFSNRVYTQLLQATEALFRVIKCETKRISDETLCKAYEKAENLFDVFLDYLGAKNIGADEQAQRYGTCSALIPYLNEAKVRRIFMDKLLEHICNFCKTASIMWKDFCVNKGEAALLDSESINTVYFYCQLLEVTISNSNGCEPKIEESFYQKIITISEEAFTLYDMFPNLAYIIGRVINAATTQRSRMKETVAKRPDIFCTRALDVIREPT